MDGKLSAAGGCRVEIAGLVCRLAGITALGGVSLEIPSGAFFGIVGPNGAGKTTLLRAIAGAVGPEAGSVLVEGFAPHETPIEVLARQISVLPQHPVVPVGVTVREAVAWARSPHLGRLARPGAADLRAVDEALEQTGAVDLADRAIEALSGGERQRVLIARALAQQPRLLLLDEPTVHLDLGRQLEIMDLLRTLAGRGLTAVAAIHDLNLAASFCDGMALLSQGRLLASGRPAQVVAPDLIREAFGAGVTVRVDARTGRPYLTVAPGPAVQGTGPRVHVICGGGTGIEILNRCAEAGCRLSVGVVHVMDADDETARAVGAMVIEEAPFSPISGAAAAEATRAALASRAVIVAPIPIGPGNLRNLEVAEAALAAGVPVIMVEGQEARDFTGGAAAAAATRLAAAGASIVRDVPAALEALSRLLARGGAQT